MKIRMGFVSNSSSSSFCILGVCVGNLYENDDYPFDKIPNGLCIEWGIADFDENDAFIGLYPADIDENETILDAKKRILKVINASDKFNKRYTLEDIGWFIDGGYNG